MCQPVKIIVSLVVVLSGQAAPFINATCFAQKTLYMDIAEITSSKMSCEECHQKVTPRIYQEHMAGVHGKMEVGCADCHGGDHRKLALVTALSACQKCHPKETAEFLASDHGKSWENMQASARYQKQPEVVKRQGCEACHRIGYGTNDGRCDFLSHQTQLLKGGGRRPAIVLYLPHGTGSSPDGSVPEIRPSFYSGHLRQLPSSGHPQRQPEP